MGKSPKFLGVDSVQGDLFAYDDKSIPFAFEGKGRIIGEIWEITDENFLYIAMMEVGAGYHLKQVETTNRKINVISFFYSDKYYKQNLKRIEEY